jgi:hypothetical protein
MSNIASLLKQEDEIKTALEYIFVKIPYREMDKRNLLADMAESVLSIWEETYPDNKMPRRAIEMMKDENATKKELERLKYEAEDQTDINWKNIIKIEHCIDVPWSAYHAIWAIRRIIEIATENEPNTPWNIINIDSVIEQITCAFFYKNIDMEKAKQEQEQIILKYFGEYVMSDKRAAYLFLSSLYQN